MKTLYIELIFLERTNIANRDITLKAWSEDDKLVNEAKRNANRHPNFRCQDTRWEVISSLLLSLSDVREQSEGALDWIDWLLDSVFWNKKKKKEINSAILVFFRHFQNEILTFAKTSGTE